MYELPIFIGGFLTGVAILEFAGVRIIPAVCRKRLPRYSGEIKLVLVVNNDISLKRDQVINAICHGVIDCYENCKKDYSCYLSEWKNNGQPKIVVKSNTQGIHKAIKGASKVKCPAVVVKSEGGAASVAGFGPAPSSLIDSLTGEFKLF